MNLIERIEQEVKTRMEGKESGHDWWHIHRVRNNALKIAASEGGDKIVIELAALLHDIADHKFHNGDLSVGPAIADELLRNAGADARLCSRVTQIIHEVSYKGAGVTTPVSSHEAAIVQDADRLDAIGAIGVARAFAYGGHKSRLLYHPDQNPTLHQNFESYRSDEGSTVNHFYEKLLLLKDRMQTPTGQQLAAARHRFLEDFLSRFFQEWNGEC